MVPCIVAMPVIEHAEDQDRGHDLDHGEAALVAMGAGAESLGDAAANGHRTSTSRENIGRLGAPLEGYHPVLHSATVSTAAKLDPWPLDVDGLPATCARQK